MLIAIENVSPGDVLLENEGKKRIEVKHVQLRPATCGKSKVHVNDNACYDRGSQVEIAD